ncbi:MAG: 50S ribosomal protein L25 [Bacteroidetes bacterium]|nr:50S ribosomal protein L25 [Bacteroidota bacterium]
MQTLTLNVQPRELGKKAVKAVRREGRVPCVLYGTHTEPVHFSVPVLDLRPLIHTSETYIVVVELDGEEYECIVKTVDFHPVSDMPVHLDFQALTRGEAITVTIPIRLEGMAAGVKDGGNLSQPLYELEIRCMPKDIPGHISVDVSDLNIGDSLHVSDIELGEAIELLTDPARTLVNVAAPRVEVEPEVEEALEMYDEEGNLIERPEEGEEGAEGEEAAEGSGEEPVE